MSEDCYDSSNWTCPTHGTPLNGAGDCFACQNGGTETVACHACGEPVKPEDAYITEFTKPDGSTETAVFHKNADYMCPLRWAEERLENIGGRLEAIVALFKYIDDGRK